MSGTGDLNAAGVSVSQERLPALNRRFDFGAYAEMRHFLDQLADLSRREDFYPNVSFGKTYANISIEAADQARLVECNSRFINEMEALAASVKSQ
ncbi:MAG: hypothetical protein M0T86_07970 [Betaproteobacteria bacterium]|nr:hypothetical protein [Betaproteobacteria bacterium]